MSVAVVKTKGKSFDLPFVQMIMLVYLMPSFLAMSFGRASLWTTMFRVL